MSGFRIPFTITNAEKLARKSEWANKFFKKKKDSRLERYLKVSDLKITREEYLGICLRILFRNFVIIFIFSLVVFYFLHITPYLYSFLISSLVSFFTMFVQLAYPRNYSSKQAREAEKNLIPAMQDILVQLQAGVPLFKIMVNISASNYGRVSSEFKKVVKEIRSGIPQLEAIDKLIEKNESIYFRRILWQISNGMRSGSDMTEIIKDGIDNLSKEQALQIQSYGSKLNPVIMFYMLMGVILPALGITFLIILSSIINFPSNIVKIIFVIILVFVILVQIMFLGIVKTRRPSLL